VAPVDRANAVPPPAKPARQNWYPWAAAARAGTRIVSSCALALRKVCRAGFAGRGTASALW